MDNGIITSSDGKSVSARNAIVILHQTWVQEMLKKQYMGFGAHDNSDDVQAEEVKRFLWYLNLETDLMLWYSLRN